MIFDTALPNSAIKQRAYTLARYLKNIHQSEMKNITEIYTEEVLGWQKASNEFETAKNRKMRLTAELASAKRDYGLAKDKMRYHEDRLTELDTNKVTAQQTAKIHVWALEVPHKEKPYAWWTVERVRRHCQLDEQLAWDGLSNSQTIQAVYLRLFNMGFSANTDAPAGFSVYLKKVKGNKDESVDDYLQRLKKTLQWVDEAVTEAAKKRKLQSSDDEAGEAPPAKRARNKM
jgi:hypothetical protein